MLQVHRDYKSHRTIVRPELERTHKDHRVQHTGPSPQKKQIIRLRVLSKRFLNSGRLAAVTTSLESLFHCPTNLSVKKFFLVAAPCHPLELPKHYLLLFPESRAQRLPLYSPHQEAAGCHEAPPQSPLSQAEQTKEHTSCPLHLCCLPLDTL